jgi:hypothetical protein
MNYTKMVQEFLSERASVDPQLKGELRNMATRLDSLGEDPADFEHLSEQLGNLMMYVES